MTTTANPKAHMQNRAETLPNASLPPSDAPPAGYIRWFVCGLLFLATTINYMDRAAMGLLKGSSHVPGTISHDLNWSEYDYRDVVNAFQIAYALGYLLAGPFIDRLGVRFGLAIAVAVWSAASAAHGLVGSVLGFATARFFLGLSEGANFPAAIKSVGEWFPKKERSLAFGFLNSGANIGTFLCQITVAIVATRYGWRPTFVVIGALGFIWLVGWLGFYRAPERQPQVTADELAYIRTDPPDPVVRVRWLSLLRHRASWAIIVGMTLTNPVWWFYLFWVPSYLAETRGLDFKASTLPMLAIYSMAGVGSIAGGWLSSVLISSGWSVNAARKSALLICALCVAPIFAVTAIHSLWPAVLIISLAAAAHQGWAANLYTLASDVMPKSAVASLVGLSCMPGAIVSIFYSDLIAKVVTETGSYFIPFALASGAYLVALMLLQILLPRIEMSNLSGVKARAG